MKVLALRLCEVGPFAKGVALEGLSGQLDVLTGPNELGKSTLFKALAILLGKEHTSRHREVEALRSDAGGAPLIEADLAIGGSLWRVRKRYLAQRAAVVSNLDSGAIWRGADAELRLQALIGAPERDPLRALVWVSQGSSFWLPEKAGADLVGSLSQLIEVETAETVGSGLQRRVREEVARRLGELLTARTGKAKAGGALERAISDHALALRRLEAARATAAAREERASRLAKLVVERDSLAQSDARRLPDRLAGLRSALMEADRAREKLRTAEERVAGRQFAAEGARGQLARLDRALAEHDELTAALEVKRAECDQETKRRDGLRIRLDEVQVERESVRALLDQQRRIAVEARRRAEHGAAIEAAKAARHQASEAARHSAEVGRLADALAAMPVDEDRVARARTCTSSIAALEARIDSASPRFTVEYAPGAAGRVAIDGRVVRGGEPVVVDRPTVLQLDGIGQIRIDPARSGLADAVGRREEKVAELRALLDLMGVQDLAAAEARLTDRQAVERELSYARARLEAVGTDDVGALERRAEEAERRARDMAPKAESGVLGELPGQDEAEARCRECEGRLAGLDSGIGALRADMAGAAERIARLSAELKAAESGLLRLAEEHPSLQDREGERARLVAAAASTQADLDDAVREKSAWAGALPRASEYESLKAEVAAAEAEAVALETRRKALERSIAELDGALRRDGEEGIGSDVGALEDVAQQAKAVLADCQQEVAALTMLAQRLDAASEAHRRDVLMPVVERLQPRLAQLLGGGRITLDGPLSVVTLERNGNPESVSRLSDGTREQIATLVRVAYAELMAERGIELPLVLDDALVFSDDSRMQAMLGVLAAAAQRHQVIVLSCRERLWDALLAGEQGKAARRLGLAPWNGEDVPLSAANAERESSCARAAIQARGR